MLLSSRAIKSSRHERRGTMVTFIQVGDSGKRLRAIGMGMLLLGIAAALLVGLDVLLVQAFSAAMMVP
jgi:hypothetical protein